MAVGVWDGLYILQLAPTPILGEGANHPTPRAQFHANECKEGRDANLQPQERKYTLTSARRGEMLIPNPKSAIPPQRVWNQPTQTHAQEPWPIHILLNPVHYDNFTRSPPAHNKSAQNQACSLTGLPNSSHRAA